MSLLSGIGTYAFSNLKRSSELAVVADAIVASIEEAKSNAISGKGGNAYGIHFDSTSYALFGGSTYNATAASNRIRQLTDNYQISTSLSGGASTIIFARMTASPSATGTISVSRTSSPSPSINIILGDLGDVTMIK